MAPTLDPGYISLTLRQAACVLETKECEEAVSASAVLYRLFHCTGSAISSHLNGGCHQSTFNSLGGKKKANSKCFNIARCRLSPGRLFLL